MTLPIVITPGDTGHIDHHEEIHELLGLVGNQTAFLVPGLDFGTFGARPAAGAANEGFWYYADDTEQSFLSDGVAWHQLATAEGETSFAADQFFVSGRPWVDVQGELNGLAGAVGDGVADDTVSVQARITALAASGGTVFFPRGTYLITTTLSIPTRVTIAGQGATSVIKTGAAVSAIVNDGSSATDIVVRDLKIDLAATGVSGVSFTTGSRQTVRNVWVTTGTGSGVGMNTCHESVVTGCRIETMTSNGISLTNSDRCRITNNYVNGVSSTAGPSGGGIRCFATAGSNPTANDNVIANNVVRDVAGYGILLIITSTGTITNCVVEGNVVTSSKLKSDVTNAAGHGVHVDAGGTLDAISHCTVRGNTIRELGQSAATSGIQVINGATNVIIEGNGIKNVEGYGINVAANCHYATIANNRIFGAEDPGIAVSESASGPCHFARVIGNIVYGATAGIFFGTDSRYYLIEANTVLLGVASIGTSNGIRIAGCSDGEIRGNICFGNPDGGIELTGTIARAVVQGNICSDAANYPSAGLHAAATQSHGIKIGNSVTDSLIADNKCSGNTTANYSFGTSTSNQVRGNVDGTSLAATTAEVVATASLPAAGAINDGRVIIEDAGAGDRNVIIYAGAQRFRIDGGAAF